MTAIAFALVRAPSPRMADAELTHLTRGAIDHATAVEQHAAYRAALTRAGVAVRCLPALDGHPDCTFVEDTVLALPELFVELRPGASSRRGEPASVMASLSDGRPVARIDAPYTIDGGDILPIGRDLYVGLSTRTTADAVDALAGIVRPHGYRVTAVPVKGALHLRTAVTALPDGTLVINPAWIDPAPFGVRARIEATADEGFGGNVLCAGETIIVQASAPRVGEAIARAGWTVATVDIGEFAKAEAGLTCLSVLVPRAA